jgi:hypothetical protein
MLEIEAFETGLQSFKRYYCSLVKSLDEDDATIKSQLREAESTFMKMRSTPKEFSGDFKDVRDDIAEYSRLGQRV